MGSFQKQPGDHAEELGLVDAAVAVHVGLLKGHSKVVTFFRWQLSFIPNLLLV